MKKTLIICLLLITSHLVFSQKCKFEFEGKDDFTGKAKKVTKDKIKMGVFIFFERTDEAYSCRLEFSYNGALDQGVAKGTEVLLKLADESIIKLYTVADHIPSKQVRATQYSASVISYVILPCAINKDELSSLSKSQIVKLRLTLGGQEFTVDIQAGKAKNVMQSASCIIQ